MQDRAPLVNRELSWLEFNARVLDEARDPSVPLLERVKFLAIFSSNLDEFFMVRVAGIRRQLDAGVTERGRDGLTPREVLDQSLARVRDLVKEQHRVLMEELLPALARHGVRILRALDLDDAQKAELHATFHRQVLPVLTPMAIDPGHPFPYLANRALSLVVELTPELDAEHLPSAPLRVVTMPVGVLPRFFRVSAPPGEHAFVLLEDIVRMHLDDLFGTPVIGCTAVRVTRDAELDYDEDSAADLLSTIEAALRSRRLGACVRLQHEPGLAPRLRELLLAELELDDDGVFATQGFTALSDLLQLNQQLDLPALRDPAHVPRAVPRLDRADVFAAIREGDVLVHHPYQSFDPVARFFRAAAEDPQVLAIKTTLYRVSAESPIARALLSAAHAGKEVAVLVELKARFNEEANIAWARRLEAAGAHVVYGIAGLKTHVKAAMVVRREGAEVRRYCHLGTGNYNEQNALVYEDFGLFTCRPAFGEDLTALFNLLTGYARPAGFRHLVVAPMDLRPFLVKRIRREVEHARAGRPARIVAKLNALVDAELIDELYGASAAGVQIDLVVRGICCLRPGVRGVSENIRVVSVVDRFLEHARVYRFENAGDSEVWLASADWMPRNLEGRIEAAFPVLDPELRAEIEAVLELELADDVKGRLIRADGTSVRRERAEGTRSQVTLIEQATVAARRNAG